MYFLLIEAAGMRQIARIHRERYDQLFEDLRTPLENAGFEFVSGDGDLLLFAESDGIKVQPDAIAFLGRRVLQVLHGRSEDLLDFSVVLDYHDGAGGEEELVRMQRLLRFARTQNTAYVTDPVLAAIAPLVNTERNGGLNRVVAFLGDGVPRRATYAESVADSEVQEQISRVLHDRGGDSVWFHGADTAMIAESLEAIAGEVPRIVVQCRPDSDVTDVLQVVVAGLPEPTGARRPSMDTGDAELDAHGAWALGLLRERFSQPTTNLLSEGWRTGELALILEKTLSALSATGRWVRVELIDADRSSPQVTDAVATRLRRPAIQLLAVASSAAPPDWTAVELRGSVSVGGVSDGDRYAAAHSYWSRPDSDPRDLPENHRRTLYLLHRLRGALDDGLLNEFFPGIGVSLAERARIFNELDDLGLIRRRWTLEVHPALDTWIATLIPEAQQRQIDETVVDLLEGQLRSGTLVLSPPIWAFLQPLLTGTHRTERRHAMLHILAGGAAFTALDRVLAHSASSAPLARASEASARLRLYLRDSRGPHHCRRDYDTLEQAVDDPGLPTAVRADVLLSMGEYLLADRRYREALDAAKRATLLRQHPGAGGAGSSHLLMARVLLVQRRLSDAGQYLGFAREEAQTDHATELIARSLDAVRLFLVGNLSRAAGQFADLEEPLLRSGFSEWLMLAWFALGRIDFELGEYRRSASRFRMTAEWARACGMERPARTVGAWTHRAEVLSDDRPPHTVEDIDELSAEELLFAAEAMIRDGLHEDVLVLLERAEQIESAADRWPRLGVCWDNGYAPLEDLIIADRAGNSELLRVIRAFRAWMLALTGRQEEAVPLFYGLTRGNDGLSVDPYAGLYNYLYSSILPRERSSDRDDRITVLGKSVKLVQERMSRIDDYRDKTRFLRYNTWNRRLMETARQHNLV